MNFLIQFFNFVLYQPLLNLLILLYLYLPGGDFGVAVIVLTLLIKLALLPSSKKSIQSQKAMEALQPKVKALQEKYKEDRQKQTVELMKLYKEAKVSPASGCLPLLLQLPVLIALYQVFIRGLQPENLTKALYSFLPQPGAIKASFLGIVDLSRPFMTSIEGSQTAYYWPVLILALLAALVQFIQTRQLSAKPKQASLSLGQKDKQADFGKAIQKQMLYVLPVLTVFIIVKFGSIIGLYWLTSSLFALGEHYWVNNKLKMKAQQPI